jgi:uncharacterized protein YbcI
MADHDLQQGRSILQQISTEVVQAFKEYYGKGPTSAKSYFVDDLLFVVMRGGLTAHEKFLIEHDEEDVVRQYRQTFENRMDAILSDKIEEITGRKVIGFQSQILFHPDMSVEIFVFDDTQRDSAAATAHGQLEQEAVGEVQGEEPTASGGDGSDKE